MKFLLVAVAASLLSFSVCAETEAQAKCGSLFRKLVSNQSKASLVLLDNLLKEGRITNHDLTEYERIATPAIKITNKMFEICTDPTLDLEQVDLIEKTLIK